MRLYQFVKAGGYNARTVGRSAQGAGKAGRSGVTSQRHFSFTSDDDDDQVKVTWEDFFLPGEAAATDEPSRMASFLRQRGWFASLRWDASQL